MAVITVGPVFDIVVPPDVFILFDAAFRDISIKLILYHFLHMAIWHYFSSTLTNKELSLTTIYYSFFIK